MSKDENIIGDLCETIESQQQEIEQLKVMLKRLYKYTGYYLNFCPVCDNHRDTEHKPDCSLAALLK